MRLTKHGHSCVRLDKNGSTLVIDPGGLTEQDVLTGVDAVLITHEHPDHLDIRRLRRTAAANPGLRVWTCRPVADQLRDLPGKVTVVGQGERFEAAGFNVQVYGERHAVIHPDLPVVPNIGFLLDEEVFHPGDAFTVPDVAVSTLLAPTNAPWMKVAELIDYVREIRPRRAYSIHDGLLNDAGLSLIDGTLQRLADEGSAPECRRLRPGQSIDI